MFVEGLVSTIIPVRNRPALLREAGLSVLRADLSAYRGDRRGRWVDRRDRPCGRCSCGGVSRSTRHASREWWPRVRRARLAEAWRAASSFNISIATICCCQENSACRSLVCDRIRIAQFRMVRRGSTLSGKSHQVWRGNGLVSIFRQCFRRFSAVALVGYLNPPL